MRYEYVYLFTLVCLLFSCFGGLFCSRDVCRNLICLLFVCREGKIFKVIVVCPLLPEFDGMTLSQVVLVYI